MSSTALIMGGRYRLDERIAAGGVGEVWRGHDTVLGRAVAVKLLRPEYTQHPETLARFRAEARHAGGVSHPGIAQVYDYGDDGQPFLVMELVDGPSLASVVAEGPLTARDTMDVAAQTAAALAAAHAAGLVHRDIKPGNLLLGPDGQVKITDFGIAYVAGSAPLTRTGTVIGTPAYLAPERVAGGSATPASDLYSLGVVCYECLTGERPFTGTPVEIALAHQHGQLPPLPPHVPAQAAALVASLAAKDPAARPAGAADVAQQAARLRDALSAGGPGGADAAGGWAVPPPVTVADPMPNTLIGTPSQVPAGAQAGWPVQPPPSAPGQRFGRPRRGRMLLLAVGAVAVVAGLLSWLLVSASGGSPQGQQAGPAATATAPREVTVNPGLLTGQRVGAVRQQLLGLGLRVQVNWRPAGDQPPGTVVKVQPGGQLPVGSTVVVTGALGPPGHGKHHSHGGDNNQGNGPGHGHGDGGGG
ncbi:MAG: serine/threonine-protein kinase [Nocardiopsaceae bacterium]|jgi:serine/threonine-protein kinase|nr:serine/threonine-protein kinase [Nocardiopsaceae bacterium]